MNDTTPSRPDLAEVLLTLGACNDTPRDAVPWARPYGGDWERALAECPQRDWLFWLAEVLLQRGHLKHEVLVVTACACARSVLHFVPAGEDRPRLALEAAERRVRGEATVEEVRTARDAATAACTAIKARAAACAAIGAHDAATACEAASGAASSAGHAAAYRAAYGASEAASHAARASTTADAILPIAKRELGPALLEGLTAYATLPGASR